MQASLASPKTDLQQMETRAQPRYRADRQNRAERRVHFYPEALIQLFPIIRFYTYEVEIYKVLLFLLSPEESHDKARSWCSLYFADVKKEKIK